MRLLVDHVPSMLAYGDRELRCAGFRPVRCGRAYIRAALRGEQQTFARAVLGPDGVNHCSLATYVPEVVDGEVQGSLHTSLKPLGSRRLGVLGDVIQAFVRT
jgi:hypothetical protein